MKIQEVLIKAVISLILVSLISACSSESPAEKEQTGVDSILYNGSVYSFNWNPPASDGTPSTGAPFKNGQWQPDAQAIAIDDGKIVAVGQNEEILLLKNNLTKVVDLEGATVFPGFHDSHVHIAELGQILSRINLIDIETPQAAVEKIKLDLENKTPQPGEWIIGQGWDEGAWANNYPDKTLLDKYFPDNPVYLKSLHGFAVWVNSAALEAIGIDEKTQAPVGGEIVKDKTGAPSGIFLNRATQLIQDNVPEPDEAQFEAWVKKGLEKMAEDGFVSVHQAGAETKHIKAFQSLVEKKQSILRIYAMLSARDKVLAQEWAIRGPKIDPDGWLDIRSVKAYYDGALGSRGARLLDDYADKPGHRGVSGEGYGFDRTIVTQLMQSGFQVGIHAIGDAGNRETLDYLQRVLQEFPETRNLRHRIEHAQVLHPDDISRLANLKVIASMEPAHAVEDKKWAEDRLGASRIKGAYAWRKLKIAGTAITLNSDLPGSDHSIFYGLHSAVTRRDKNLQPQGGWFPEENLTIEEAIRGFTIDAAFSAFHEDKTGIIAKGRWADMTVVDKDLMKLAVSNPDELLSGKIVLTMINGNIVYQRDQ